MARREPGVFMTAEDLARRAHARLHHKVIGNIGTSAYMLYLPDYDASIAVMINPFGGGCASRMVRETTRVTALYLKPGPFWATVRNVRRLLLGRWWLAGTAAALHVVRKRKPFTLFPFGGRILAAGWASRKAGDTLRIC